MKTEILLVKERALRCVEVTRTISLEVPVGYRGPQLLRRLLAEGEQDYGPFASFFSPVPGTEYLEPVRLWVIGTTDEPADIPFARESEVGT